MVGGLPDSKLGWHPRPSPVAQQSHPHLFEGHGVPEGRLGILRPGLKAASSCRQLQALTVL
jgi:hypothetical protein